MMKANRQTRELQEPVGIVISRGAHEETPTRFSAYVWGPAPEGDAETSGAKAA
jgi:hypothetical protein